MSKRTLELILLLLVTAFFIACYLYGMATMPKQANTPGTLAQSVQLIHPSFEIDYRPDLGIPQAVRWAVTRSSLGETKREPTFKFKADHRAPRPRVKSDLYTRSGYDRGHMCPAADRSSSKESMRQTFVMTNVCPQVPAVNTGAWKKTENFERRIALEQGRCSVWAAPLFYPGDTAWIGKHRVAVPDAFFKIVFDKDPARVYGMFIVNNI